LSRQHVAAAKLAYVLSCKLTLPDEHTTQEYLNALDHQAV
jgi:hypothetical protein